MTKTEAFQSQARDLIDNLKAVCANYGLGNDGNEFKIITQVFLYKFLNDQFAYEVKRLDPETAKSESWEAALKEYTPEAYKMLTLRMGGNTAILKPEHLITTLYMQQNEANFSEIFDDTLTNLAALNSEVFSVSTEGGAKVVLFEPVSQYISNPARRSEFCKGMINKLVNFSFEDIFSEKFDFWATLFEYMIKDYNKDGGGKYAEYYTPHAVARIMARCLVQEEVQNVTCYDPSAGSGTLLMNLAHEIGEDCCTIYSEDISQKSSHLLRLNLILNKLVHSIPNIIQGNTLLHPSYAGQQFDYIVSNPPFKLDFSDFRNELDKKENNRRFFAGVPKVPPKSKDKMAIYQLFLQHIIDSLKDTGKAAVVVPTGFLTAQQGIDKKIRRHLVDERMLGGVISMPSNIFATTGTNVSILFLDANNKEKIILIDASALGQKVKSGKNQKTVLTEVEEERIINTFNEKKVEDDFSVAVSYKEIEAKNYSLSAGQYFEVKIEYVEITPEEFQEKIDQHIANLKSYSNDSAMLETELTKIIEGLNYDL
ncbi:MAG: type I restriction-modification system subunit M [Opitutales bacterium]|nr:type I restriction-modification system subunit M [Opitutales bacterium]